MKFIFHFPGLVFIALCGLVCIVLGLDETEEWLRQKYLELSEEAE